MKARWFVSVSLMHLSHRVGGLTVYLIELKLGNILLLPSDVGNIVMHDLPEQPVTICNFPKTTPPNDPPLFYSLETDQCTEFRRVVADPGHGAFTRWVTGYCQD